MGVERTTVIVGPDGVITHLWRKVGHEGNAAMVEAALREKVVAG
jgi:peroxiredoxin